MFPHRFRKYTIFFQWCSCFNLVAVAVCLILVIHDQTLATIIGVNHDTGEETAVVRILFRQYCTSKEMRRDQNTPLHECVLFDANRENYEKAHPERFTRKERLPFTGLLPTSLAFLIMGVIIQILSLTNSDENIEIKGFDGNLACTIFVTHLFCFAFLIAAYFVEDKFYQSFQMQLSSYEFTRNVQTISGHGYQTTHYIYGRGHDMVTYCLWMFVGSLLVSVLTLLDFYATNEADKEVITAVVTCPFMCSGLLLYSIVLLIWIPIYSVGKDIMEGCCGIYNDNANLGYIGGATHACEVLGHCVLGSILQCMKGTVSVIVDIVSFGWSSLRRIPVCCSNCYSSIRTCCVCQDRDANVADDGSLHVCEVGYRLAIGSITSCMKSIWSVITYIVSSVWSDLQRIPVCIPVCCSNCYRWIRTCQVCRNRRVAPPGGNQNPSISLVHMSNPQQYSSSVVQMSSTVQNVNPTHSRGDISLYMQEQDERLREDHMCTQYICIPIRPSQTSNLNDPFPSIQLGCPFVASRQCALSSETPFHIPPPPYGHERTANESEEKSDGKMGS